MNPAISRSSDSESFCPGITRVVISIQIPSSRDVPAAINRGVPIIYDNPKHPVSVAIRQFAEKFVLIGHPTDSSIPPELRSDRRGLLRRKAKTS